LFVLFSVSCPSAPGQSGFILFREVDRFDERNSPHQDEYYRIKILTEEGRSEANVEIPFLKDKQEVVHIGARTIRPDGTTVEFNGQVFEKYLVKGKGQRVLAKTFTLQDVEVGSIIEYYFTIDLQPEYVWDSHWIVSGELFTKDAKFTLKPFTGANVPLGLRWSWHNLPPGVQPKQDQGKAVNLVHMEVHNLPGVQREEYMPPYDEVSARVIFVYEDNVVFETDPDKYWRSYDKEEHGKIEGFVNKRKAMEEAVGQMMSPSDPPEVKLRKIYDRVQQVRNTSYEPNKTEQELKRDNEKPIENVEDLWKRGYGTGVQLTWLYLGLVRAAGFEAYGCMVSSRGSHFFDPKTMERRLLDANVVLVKLNGKDLYFDPGAKFTPFGMLTWSETGVPGMRLDKEGGTWILTTLPEASESTIQRNAKLQLSDTGSLEGKVTITFTGLSAMRYRLEERNADEVARKKFLEEWIVGEIPVAADADLTNQPDWSSSETPLVAEFNLKVPGWVSGAGKRALMPVALFSAPEKQVFEHADRVHPIYFEYPYEKLDDVTINLPLGWQVSSIPAAQSLDKNIVAYAMKAEKDQASVRLTRKFVIDGLMVEQKYYPALRAFFQQVRSGDEEQVVLQPGATTASN
jgi:hypothetical protein